MTLSSVCVFCASSDGARPDYLAAGRRVGGLLAERGIGVVFGGGRVGVMGALADGVLAAGGKIIGVIPRQLVAREVAHGGVDLRVVGSMHERKQLMHDLSDGFLTLPGGFGTLEELFETLTWAQLGMHRKPCGLLNVAGYYDGLLAMLDHAVTEGLVAAVNRRALLADEDAGRLIDAMSAFEPPVVRQWIERGEE